jgi:hypothetical protein
MLNSYVRNFRRLKLAGRLASLPLIAILVTGFVVDGMIRVVVQLARRRNLEIHSITRPMYSENRDHLPSLDGIAWPSEWLTTQFLGQPCQIGRLRDCEIVDSKGITAAKAQSLPPVAARLTNGQGYSSLYTLMRALAVRRADDDLVALARPSLADLRQLDQRVLATYLIRPAMDLVTRGLAQEGVRLFDRYISISRQYVLAHRWYSEVGVDHTDLPVLVDLFCTSPVGAVDNICVVGLLTAIANGGDDPLKIAPAYAALPAPLRNDALAMYLSLWSWSGRGDAPSIPSELTPGQRAAWRYATAVALRSAAGRTNSTETCHELIKRSTAEFRQVVALDSEMFTPLAQGHLSGLAAIERELCLNESR